MAPLEPGNRAIRGSNGTIRGLKISRVWCLLNKLMRSYSHLHQLCTSKCPLKEQTGTLSPLVAEGRAPLCTLTELVPSRGEDQRTGGWKRLAEAGRPQAAEVPFYHKLHASMLFSVLLSSD